MSGTLAKFKGPDADPNWQYLALPLSCIALMSCFGGSAEGLVLRGDGGEDTWRDYAWSLETVAFNAGLLLFWGFGMWVSGGIAKPWIKWAGRIFISLIFFVSATTIALAIYAQSLT